MRQSSVLYLVAPSLARAAWQKLQPGSGSMPLAGAAGLLARQNGECTIHSSCSGCFGEGYVICDTIGCFNPDIYQQCCAGACKFKFGQTRSKTTANGRTKCCAWAELTTAARTG
jgi:hypothetical protein